jgi:hypothetical protein
MDNITPIKPIFTFPDYIAFIHNHNYNPISIYEFDTIKQIFANCMIDVTIIRLVDNKRFMNMCDFCEDKGNRLFIEGYNV